MDEPMTIEQQITELMELGFAVSVTGWPKGQRSGARGKSWQVLIENNPSHRDERRGYVCEERYGDDLQETLRICRKAALKQPAAAKGTSR